MKNFLTLLATITSLSAYTLVGVHAKCATCPSSPEGGVWLKSRCTRDRTTACLYQRTDGSLLSCDYNDSGDMTGGSLAWCPKHTQTDNGCYCDLS